MGNYSKVICVLGGINESSKYDELCIECSAVMKSLGFHIAYDNLNTTGIIYKMVGNFIEIGGKVLNYHTNDSLERLKITTIEESEHQKYKRAITFKQKIIEKFHNFLILPGGYGTLNELGELLFFNKRHPIKKNVIILNYQKYWNGLIELAHNISESGLGLSHNNICTVIGNPKELKEALEKIRDEK